ncbi:MAG: 4-hydroxythreonine-4-phosphate dehydrogenase PdxA [candidate division KSB1 bacterium]|nr:4-hydroxythreonine-4-phosphate dehydrogenase PdxA [candidate division KSB1 bacterium]MDZ7317947.1 4-hydroxythreonine-4-phosphate dehydrogenase PdxA [candidate division KSB1 bacterium]MDZ7341971.1 4-hydroxythreonine-4-phosphate dehydrogenase PdxA [candidate division KSB1 bacterium]
MIKPIIGITMGDPAGIGPEIAARALSRKAIYDICRPVIVGDAGVMQQAIGIARVKLAVHPISKIAAAKFEPGTLDVLDLHNANLDQVKHGLISAPAGEAAFQAVKKVIELALEGQIAATVTGPIHKEALNLAGHSFAGHTEIYAHYTQTKDFAMLLVSDNFRVIHVSTHVPVRQAADLVKRDRVFTVIRLLHQACQQFGIEQPRIGVAALNPHASDGGLFGHEEEDEIIPAIEAARDLGWEVEGPLPPDILFPKAKGGGFDGCVAMYHDQGHIPFKLDGFTWNRKLGRMESVKGINITLGIPIIRVSVDHGTAFEIAGMGIANPDSLIMAIEYATKMAVAQKSDSSFRSGQ